MTDSPETVLVLKSLYKRFDSPAWVVKDVSLEVKQGELLCVLGPSGCGKTTLLRLVGGFETPDQGEVLQNASVISQPGWALPPEKRQMGMVFQDYALFPHLTVRENVQFGLQSSPWQRLTRRSRLSRLSAATATATATANKGQALARGKTSGRMENHADASEGLVKLLAMAGLTEMADRYPHELSGGQQQRVALARAMAPRPGLLLLDEPFSNLDTTLRQRLRDEVKHLLKQAGTTSILVTHDQEEAINMADRLAIMNEAGLEQLGTPYEVMEHPASRFVATFIGVSRFVPGAVEGDKVVSELGRFPLPAKGAPSRQVDMLVRPTRVFLSGGNQRANNHGSRGDPVNAKVVQLHFLGGQPLHTLALPSGREIQALLPEEARLSPGDTATIHFAPETLVLFRAE